MVWLCDKRLYERHYKNDDEKRAFRAGYFDCWHNFPHGADIQFDLWPNAYSAGYWEGNYDKENKND